MKHLTRVNQMLARVIQAGMVVMVAVMLLTLAAQVVMRYVFSTALSWSEEMSMALFSWTVLLGTTLGVQQGFHVRLTLLVERVPPRWRHLAERGIHLLTAAFGAYLAFAGWQYVDETRGMTSAAIGYPVAYLHLAVPVCGILIALFALEHALLGTIPAAEAETDV